MLDQVKLCDHRIVEGERRAMSQKFLLPPAREVPLIGAARTDFAKLKR
jgi:hypothetical protein